MKNKTWHCLGVMSGTSLDGVDIAYIKFTESTVIEYSILEATSIPYDSLWRGQLERAFTATASEIIQLHVDYGKYLGKLITSFISKNNIKELDFVASHGHTIFHNPAAGYTFQLGDGATIAAVSKQKIICDFRTQDVAKGGEGAPLVPIGDRLLFSDYDYCLNIGGFANVSFENITKREAYDVCPANIVLNHYTRAIGLEFDDKGNLSKTGTINSELLSSLEHLSIYKEKNSMGNEFVVSDIIPLIDSFKIDTPSILKTVSEHIALKIGPLFPPKAKVLATGGGVFNQYLMSRIEKHTSAKIIMPDETLVNFKEALIFGLLGLLRLENRVNILSSVTHASEDHSSGIIF